MPPRKRRRSQAFPESDGEDRGVTSEHLVSGGNDLDKERDVWDSFREEHFEGIALHLMAFSDLVQSILSCRSNAIDSSQTLCTHARVGPASPW